MFLANFGLEAVVMAAAQQDPAVAGHTFLSYVREDSAQVDRLQRVLQEDGIPVWRDRSDLWPGEDWQAKIRKAITDDALAFIACFSGNSLARIKSYQNEELVLAVEQLRLRRPEQPWLIPVRFDDCEIPDWDLGGGRRLASLQWVDLFGNAFDEGAARLVAAIRRILEPSGASQARTRSQGCSMSSRPTAIEALAEEPAASGLILDYDGVLSPIVGDPTSSSMPDPVRAILVRLAVPLGLLAVMSGRPVDYLADHVRVPGALLLGSYGIEQLRDGQRLVDPGAKHWLGLVGVAARALSVRLAGSPGVRVEKKSVSVAVHWRQAPDPAVTADEVHRVTAGIAAETGLRLEPGKFTEELRLPVDVDKGSAIIALLGGESLTTIAYAGDDFGDIRALRAGRELGGYALVVNHGSDTDPQLLRVADQSYAGTEGFAAWLAELADAIGVLRQLSSASRQPHTKNL